MHAEPEIYDATGKRESGNMAKWQTLSDDLAWGSKDLVLRLAFQTCLVDQNWRTDENGHKS